MTTITWRDAGEMEVWLTVIQRVIGGNQSAEDSVKIADSIVQACRDRRPAMINNVAPTFLKK